MSDNDKIFESYRESQIVDEAEGGSKPGGGFLGNFGQKMLRKVPGRTGLAAKGELKMRERIKANWDQFRQQIREPKPTGARIKQWFDQKYGDIASKDPRMKGFVSAGNEHLRNLVPDQPYAWSRSLNPLRRKYEPNIEDIFNNIMTSAFSIQAGGDDSSPTPVSVPAAEQPAAEQPTEGETAVDNFEDLQPGDGKIWTGDDGNRWTIDNEGNVYYATKDSTEWKPHPSNRQPAEQPAAEQPAAEQPAEQPPTTKTTEEIVNDIKNIGSMVPGAAEGVADIVKSGGKIFNTANDSVKQAWSTLSPILQDIYKGGKQIGDDAVAAAANLVDAYNEFKSASAPEGPKDEDQSPADKVTPATPLVPEESPKDIADRAASIAAQKKEDDERARPVDTSLPPLPVSVGGTIKGTPQWNKVRAAYDKLTADQKRDQAEELGLELHPNRNVWYRKRDGKIIPEHLVIQLIMYNKFEILFEHNSMSSFDTFDDLIYQLEN